MKASTSILAYAATALAAAAVLPAAGQAQEIGDTSSIVIAPQLERTDVAGSRTESEFAPEPIRAGPLLVNASLSLVGGYDTNALDRTVAEGDAAVMITPRVTVRADTARHLLQLSALGHVRRFADIRSENSEEFDLRAQTRLDFAERQSFFANAGYSREIESRSSVGTVGAADEPVNFDVASVQAGFDVELGRLWLRPQGHFEESDYAPITVGGTTTDLSFRNTRRTGGELAVGYKFSDLFAAFGEAGYSETESTDAPAAALRDADDKSLLVGVRGDVSPLVSAEFAVGYRERDYALARYLDYEGFTYRADVQWYITPLVTLRLEASQNFLNSGNAQVAGILSNRIAVSGYFDPLRNLRLSATLAYEHNEFRETDTTAKRPSARLAAQYQANSHLSLGIFAGLRRQDVSGPLLVQPYTSFSTGLGITVTP